MSDWFEQVFGFRENERPGCQHQGGKESRIHQNMSIDGTVLRSQANGRSFQCGHLECLSLQELRQRASSLLENSEKKATSRLHISELVGDVSKLHSNPANEGATFQVASQFNLLEMVSPRNTPEQGISRYAMDPTQGPACAIACAAGTIVRNYFVKVDGSEHVGQTRKHQVDCLTQVGKTLGNSNRRLWSMENGYAMASQSGLEEIGEKLASLSGTEADQLRSQLRIGVQWNTQVTLHGCEHLVTQVYCSALPVAYSILSINMWESFARFVLDASYEATFWAAVLNAKKTGNKTVFLTLLGGGAFGNDDAWIFDSIGRSCPLFQEFDLDVKVVSYRSSSTTVRELCSSIRESIRESS
mmetsp:Transcript_396/g.561  ORF Transcript_396/g.561 Transcript_396/m.561 type:complete len:357 (+) Transcript_396:88-1158(+)